FKLKTKHNKGHIAQVVCDATRLRHHAQVVVHKIMKKLILILIQVLFLCILNACEMKHTEKELESNFTIEQIADLRKITEFFKNSICDDTGLDFKVCFNEKNYGSLLVNAFELLSRIDFDEQQKLYKQISSTTFDEIWMFCEATRYPSKRKFQDICSVYDGKYQKYLIDLGKKNIRIAKYADKIQASGGFNVFDIGLNEIFKENSYFDLDDPNIQLILAIHFLSINDQIKRNPLLNELEEPLKIAPLE
ncbi:hypothetical protein, partial [Sediminitomix flava]